MGNGLYQVKITLSQLEGVVEVMQNEKAEKITVSVDQKDVLFVNDNNGEIICIHLPTAEEIAKYKEDIRICYSIRIDSGRRVGDFCFDCGRITECVLQNC